MKPKEFVEQAKRELPTRLQMDGGFIHLGQYIGWEMFSKTHLKANETEPPSGYLWLALNSDTMERLEGYVTINPELTPHQNDGALFGDIFTQIKSKYARI